MEWQHHKKQQINLSCHNTDPSTPKGLQGLQFGVHISTGLCCLPCLTQHDYLNSFIYTVEKDVMSTFYYSLSFPALLRSLSKLSSRQIPQSFLFPIYIYMYIFGYYTFIYTKSLIHLEFIIHD